MRPNAIGHGQWITAVENVAVVLVRAPGTADTLRRLRDEVLELSTAVGPLGFFYVVDGARAVGLVDEATREVLMDTVRAIRDKLVASALVVAVTGFAGASMRAAISTFTRAERSKSPTRVFHREREAAAWLAQQLRAREFPSPEPASIVEAVASMRRQGSPLTNPA